MKQLLKTLVLIVYVTTASCSNNLHKHVLQQMKLGQDTTSTSLRRVYEIYSKATGKRVQIRGKRVDANGIPGDIYARLEISSISFGSRVTIRSVANGRYLCMSKKGRLIAKIKRINSRCHFTEKIGENYFDTFTNVRRAKWYLAFHHNGRPKRGSRTSSRQAEVMFLKRPVQQMNGQSNSFISEAKQAALTIFRKKIRMSYLADSKDDNSNFPKQTRMMQDDPGVVLDIPIIPTDPPEIQKEIEERKRQALKKLIYSVNVVSATTSSYHTSLPEKLRDKIKHKEMLERKTKKQHRKRKHNKLLRSHSTPLQSYKQKKASSDSKSPPSTFQSLREAIDSPTIPSMLQIYRISSRKNLNSRKISQSLRKDKINNLLPLESIAGNIT